MSITLSDHILSLNSFLAFNISWINYESVPAHMSAHITVSVTLFFCKSPPEYKRLLRTVLQAQCVIGGVIILLLTNVFFVILPGVNISFFLNL